MIRLIKALNTQEIKSIMQEMGVDPYGITIMLPKARAFLLKVNSVSCISANILKQEMLSLGADVAVSRSTLTGKARSTDCLLMGNLAQFKRLNEKLKLQPFGLAQFAKDLSSSLANYGRDNFRLLLGKKKLNLSRRCAIMGILNLTPDSFSGDGLYGLNARVKNNTSMILDYALQMAEDGADIIDLGGESSRPQARSVSVNEELKRVIPAIKLLARKLKVPVSIDTRKPEVARQALECGATMVNDISGLRDKRLAGVVAKYKAAVVIMHMKGTPATMQKKAAYKSLIDEIIGYLDAGIKRALEAGVGREKIIIDPGIGFAKTFEHNLKILNKLNEFKVLGKPIMVGTSRKSFIGKILNEEPNNRLSGTISSCVLAAQSGANILRVHDVKAVKQALDVFERIAKA